MMMNLDSHKLPFFGVFFMPVMVQLRVFYVLRSSAVEFGIDLSPRQNQFYPAFANCQKIPHKSVFIVFMEREEGSLFEFPTYVTLFSVVLTCCTFVLPFVALPACTTQYAVIVHSYLAPRIRSVPKERRIAIRRLEEWPRLGALPI